MWIQRIEVEGGFLDGLDLSFKPGFNALIGARGTGKTSVIELIRFALHKPILSDRSRVQLSEHAAEILQDGQVTVTVSRDEKLYRVARSLTESSNRIDGADDITILAQNEIEHVGEDAISRLRLIDGFRPSNSPSISDRELQSLETEYAALRTEVQALDDQLATFVPVIEELIAARSEQKALQSRTSLIEAQEKALQEISKRAQDASKSLEQAKRAKLELTSWEGLIRTAADRVPQFGSLTSPLFDKIIQGQAELNRVKETLERSLFSSRSLDKAFDDVIAALSHVISMSETEARPIRANLEQAHRGAGDLARKIAALERRVAQGDAIAEVKLKRVSRLEAIRASRSVILDQIEATVSEKTTSRELIARKLTKHLKPQIRIAIAQKANLTEYITSISRLLRGTGLQTHVLARQIASRISPRQLVEFAETNNKLDLSRVLGITGDRAQKLISAMLSASSYGPLLVTPIEDDVSIEMLVGADFRPIQKLSTGQRCTAIVPILLSKDAGSLIIDQPEDHLDNAYVVQTLVAAIRNRAQDLQIIFSTHNANIPVLGNADLVIEMASDGDRGYARVVDVLESASAVSAITTIMEGGREAFAMRAEFYKSHSS